MHARGVPKWTEIRRMKMMLNISFVKIFVRSMMIIIETRSLKIINSFRIIIDIVMAV